MKLKSLIFLSLILLTGNIFAQKPAVAPAYDKAPKAAKLPAARKIIANYVKAIGGREANEKIRTRVAKGTVEIIGPGIKGTIETFGAAPDKSVSNINLAGFGLLIEAYNGKTGWSRDPMQGGRDKSGDELLQAKLISNFHRDINIEKLYSKIEVKGVDKVDNTDVYVLVLTPDGLPAETLYFDQKTGLLLRLDMTIVSAAGNSAAQTFLEDYREVDGIKTPFKTRTVTPQFELVTIYTEIKNNVAIDDAKFAKPL
jgi:zinc protease